MSVPQPYATPTPTPQLGLELPEQPRLERGPIGLQRPATVPAVLPNPSSPASTTKHLGPLYSVGVADAVLWALHSLAVVVFGISLWQLLVYSSQSYVIAWCVGGFFVCLAVPISLHDMKLHVNHYVSPLQRHYVRCLAMVPIYAAECE